MIFHIELLVNCSYELVVARLGDNISSESEAAIEAVKLWFLNWTFISELSGHKLHEDTGAKGADFFF